MEDRVFLKDSNYHIYTDGSGHGGTGGWGFVILNSKIKITGFGAAVNTTNNQMEMLAVIKALSCLRTTVVKTCGRCGYRVIEDHCIKQDQSIIPNGCDLKCSSSDYKNKRKTGLSTITVFSDSEYVIKGITEYIKGWKDRGYRGATGSKVKNVFLWREIDNLNNIHSPNWKWVKGHSGIEYNEEADSLAGEGRQAAKLYLSDDVKDITSVYNMKKELQGSYKDLLVLNSAKDNIKVEI